MAIIPIKDIPSNKTLNPSQRDLIRQDIRYAIKLGVPKFELDDERYKYNTLAGSAKEAFKSLFTNEIYRNAAIKAEKRLNREFPEKTVAIPGSSDYFARAKPGSVIFNWLGRQRIKRPGTRKNTN